MTTKTAPDISPGYPSKGAKLGPLWLDVWRALERSAEPIDRHILAERYAAKHGLAESTVISLVARAAKAGLLTGEPRPVVTGRGMRTRTFYRIKGQADG